MWWVCVFFAGLFAAETHHFGVMFAVFRMKPQYLVKILFINYGPALLIACLVLSQIRAASAGVLPGWRKGEFNRKTSGRILDQVKWATLYVQSPGGPPLLLDLSGGLAASPFVCR